MFEEKYKELYNQISPDVKLIDNIIDKAQNKKIKLKFPYYKKLSVMLASVSICIILSVPVLAKNSLTIYELMYLVSPNIAQNFAPIQEVCVDNGIKMEVVSVYIHDDMAEIYITMQDLEGDRVDETIDLYDSYSIKTVYDTENYCERIGYDEATKTATFLINIKNKDWGNVRSNRVTFLVKKFLSDKKYYKDIDIPIDLSSIKTVSAVSEAQNVTGGWGKDDFNLDTNEIRTVLTEQQPLENFAVEGIKLTAVGYIEDKLHIQTAVEDVLNNDNHGYFYLKDFVGNIVNCDYCISFDSTYKAVSGRVGYSEYVFDIPKSNISNYTLHGNFTTSGNITEGDWSVTFSLDR